MHKFDFKNQTAIVTGGAQGFGLDIAKRFLESGCNVFIWDIDENLLPDICGDVTNMENIESNSYDLICAFQTLEHLHYEKYLLAIKNEKFN